MRFNLLASYDVSIRYKIRSLTETELRDHIDVYRFFELSGLPRDFEAAAKQLLYPSLFQRWGAFWALRPIVPYVSVFRNGEVQMELEIGVVCLRNCVSVLFFGSRDEVRVGDQIQFRGCLPRHRPLSFQEDFFVKPDVLPAGSMLGKNWIQNIKNKSF